MRPAAPLSLMNSGHRSKLKVVLVLFVICQVLIFRIKEDGIGKNITFKWVQKD